MSVLSNGTEDLPQGLTPAAAYAIVNTAIQKLALMNLHEQVIPFFGLVRDGAQHGKSAIAIERLVTAVEIRIEGDAPVASPLIVQLVLGGSLQSQQFTVAAAATYALITASSGGLVVAANTVVEARMISGNQASDVVVTLKSQLRIL